MKRYLAFILAAMMLVAAFAGCSAKEEEEKGPTYGVYRDYVKASIPTLNMVVKNDGILVARPMQTVLYKAYINEAGDAFEYRGQLAAEEPIQMDEEGKVWQIKIRDDYYWADYGPTAGLNAQMTADTVMYTYKMCIDPDLLNINASMLVNSTSVQIVNAYEYQQQLYTSNEVAWEDVGIKKIDDFTIEITSKVGTNKRDVMDYMGNTTCLFMVYEPLYEACMGFDRTWTSYGTSFDTWASSGEYMLKEWIPDGKLTMIRNPNYVHADMIKLGAIEYYTVPDTNTALEMFEAGQLDHCELIYQQWEQYEEDPRVRLYYNDSATYVWISNGNPNNNNLLGNYNFRASLHYGLDRVEFAEFLGGSPSTRMYRRCVIAEQATGKSILEVPVDWADDPYNVRDSAKAAQLLAKAYEEVGITGADLECYHSEASTHVRASAEIFTRQINDNFEGLNMKIRVVPSNIAYTLRRWNPSQPTAYEFNLGSLLPSDDPIDTMTYWDPDSPQRAMCWVGLDEWANKYREVLNEAREAVRAMDEVKTVELCLEMERLLVDEWYLRIPLYELASKVLYSERVKLPVNERINGYGFGEVYSEIIE